MLIPVAVYEEGSDSVPSVDGGLGEFIDRFLRGLFLRGWRKTAAEEYRDDERVFHDWPRWLSA